MNPVRLVISSVWASMLFVFAYVDLFALYRADVRADLDAGRVAAFDVNQAFLLFTTAYVVVPSVMIYLTLVLPAGVCRVLNIVLAVVYVLTIVGSAVGETWGYYLLGSGVELVLLAALVWHAVRWHQTPARAA